MIMRPLRFDTHGNARIRFIRQIYQPDVHWAEAKVAQLKLVCPNSVPAPTGAKVLKNWEKNNPLIPCKECATGKATSTPRMLAFGWDVENSCWCGFIGHELVFAEVMGKIKALGVNPQMMGDGQGPDVILTRIGKKTLAEVLPNTLGTSYKWGSIPTMDEMLSQVRFKSVYCSMTVEQVNKEYSEDSVTYMPEPFEGQTFQGVALSGAPGPFIGTSGWSGFSGTAGSYGLKPAVASQTAIQGISEKMAVIVDTNLKDSLAAKGVKGVKGVKKKEPIVPLAPTGEEFEDDGPESRFDFL